MWRMLREWRRRRLWHKRPMMIRVYGDGNIRYARIIAVAGMCLRVADGRGERLITQTMAVNHAEFWRAWRAWSGDPVMRTPDGVRYTPWKT